MTKIKVLLEAFYGYSCCGCGHGSNENIEVEVNDAQLEALRQIGKEKITCEDITKAIAQGTTVLEPLHEQLEEKYYYMVEEYWLYEAYNEINLMDDDKVKQDFHELYELMNGMPLREMDRIIYPVCTLCRDHERSGFIHGVQVGIRLAEELK